MPLLTEDQVFEALMELDEEQRVAVFERIEAQLHPVPQLSEEHKGIIRNEIEAHRRDPSTSISRDELMAQMRVTL